MQDPLIGQSIGSYHITRLLGEGGFGRVYLAEHPVIGKKAALKVLHRELAVNETVVKRFMAEAKVIAMLNHPNILSAFDFGTLPDGRYFILMEYIEGTELTKIMKHHKSGMTPSQAWHYISQVGEALAAAHAKGIVHRDLKPDNIVVEKSASGQEIVKVLDFGIAKLLENTDDEEPSRMTKTGQVLGTPAYMSPEQARGETDRIGPWTDIYSLGVILYEILTGTLPITGRSTADMLVRLLTQPPRPLSEVAPHLPVQVENILMRALEKEPEKRYRDIRLFMNDLQQAIGAVPTEGLSTSNPLMHTEDPEARPPEQNYHTGDTYTEALKAASTAGISDDAYLKVFRVRMIVYPIVIIAVLSIIILAVYLMDRSDEKPIVVVDSKPVIVMDRKTGTVSKETKHEAQTNINKNTDSKIASADTPGPHDSPQKKTVSLPGSQITVKKRALPMNLPKIPRQKQTFPKNNRVKTPKIPSDFMKTHSSSKPHATEPEDPSLRAKKRKLLLLRRKISELSLKSQQYAPLLTAASNTMSNVIQRYSTSIGNCIGYYSTEANYKKNKRPVPPRIQNYVSSCDRKYPKLRKYVKQDRSTAFMKMIEHIPEYSKAKKEYDQYNKELKELVGKLRRLSSEMQLLQMELDDDELRKLK